MSTPKETAYDAIISPLMQQIIEACKEHKINAFATFALDQNEDDGKVLRCTTSLPVDPSDEEGYDLVNKVCAIVRPRPTLTAFTIVTRRA